jgi:hypothetical protein
VAELSVSLVFNPEDWSRDTEPETCSVTEELAEERTEELTEELTVEPGHGVGGRRSGAGAISEAPSNSTANVKIFSGRMV